MRWLCAWLKARFISRAKYIELHRQYMELLDKNRSLRWQLDGIWELAEEELDYAADSHREAAPFHILRLIEFNAAHALGKKTRHEAIAGEIGLLRPRVHARIVYDATTDAE